MENEEQPDIENLLKTELPTRIIREVKVQENKAGTTKQYSIKLPISFVEELNIKKGDVFIIELNPETMEYSFKLKEKNKWNIK